VPCIRLASQLRPVLGQQLVEFVYAQPFRRAFGQTLQAAFGPQLPARRVESLEVEISHASLPFTCFAGRARRSAALPVFTHLLSVISERSLASFRKKGIAFALS
jgi:hypothetical protein